MASSSSPWQRFLRDLKIEDMLGAGPTEELKVDMLNRIIFLKCAFHQPPLPHFLAPTFRVNWWFGGLCSKDETVKDAIDLLTRNKIISAPVYDDDANQYHSNSRHSTVGWFCFCCSAFHHLSWLLLSRFIGFVDMLDLATLCVEHLSAAVRALSSEI